MEPEITKCQRNIRNSPKTFSNLSYIKCLFFTNKQFNEEAESYHKPKESLYIEKDIDGRNRQNIVNSINEIIIGIYRDLNKDNPTGDYKIPAPIFVMMGRKLEKKGSIFENQNITKIEDNYININGMIIPNPIIKEVSIISYINDYLSSIFATKDDINKYNKSMLNTYEFKNNVKIFVYVPYMTNKYKYITNFVDLINSSTFISSIINNAYYLGVDPTIIFDEEKFKETNNKLSNSLQHMFININTNQDSRKYRFYDELVNLCYDGGCISDIGEDFQQLLPNFTNDESTDTDNAIKKSPYLPNKCLSKTNNFICNMKDVENNVSLNQILKENGSEELTNSLTQYENINMKINKGLSVSDDENKLISDYNKSPINLLISIVNSYISSSYSTNLDEKDKKIKRPTLNEKGVMEEKEISLKLNHYSKDYSINMIKELSYINNKYPSIPEIVTTMYVYKEEILSNLITYMPFGKQIPSNYNVLHFGYEQEINEKVYSVNKEFALMINNNGLIYVLNRKINQIHYFLNRTFIKNALSMNISESGISVNYIDDNNNKNNRNVLNIKMINDKNPRTKPPYSCIINDLGIIVVYGNAFLNSTSDEFNRLIENEIDFIKSLDSGIDPNALDNLDENMMRGKNKLDDLNILNKNEKYVYRSMSK